MWYKVNRIMVWDKQVRPYRYNPWSNTLLYMPLNWNVKDEVSWNNGTWSWTAQYQTLASWLKVANCNTSSYILTPSFAMNTAMTISWWLYRSGGNVIFRADGKTGTRNLYEISVNENWWAWWWRYYNWNSYLYNSWSNSWWKHIVATFWNEWIKIYVNGIHTHTTNITSFVWKTQQWWINYDQYSTVTPIPWAWYYSDLIVESRAWTATEVSNYYNQTKSNYWL